LAVNAEEYGIVENVRLRHILSGLKGEKIILTNNPSSYARKILTALGVEDLFSRIIGVEEQNFVLKPDRRAFRFLMQRIKNGERIVFVDDDKRNIVAAKRIGCETVLADGF
jgi:putative hydrolase of the HAD superfamily